MSDVKFNLKLASKRSPRLAFSLIPVDYIPFPEKIQNINRPEIIHYASQYDIDDPWWASEETQLGKIIQDKMELDREILHRVIHWKFLTLHGREGLVKGYLEANTDEEIRSITKQALSYSNHFDDKRIKTFRRLNGIGIALASTILTFYDPQNYGVYDIHVYREMYGPEPSTIFTSNIHYIQMLQDLRRLAKKFDLPVRTIEKALFKKNIVTQKNVNSYPILFFNHFFS